MSERKPAEVFHPSVFIREEMDERGWSLPDLAARMCPDFEKNLFAMQLYMAVQDPDLLLGDCKDLARAFGDSPESFLNLEKAYRAGCAAPDTGALEKAGLGEQTKAQIARVFFEMAANGETLTDKQRDELLEFVGVPSAAIRALADKHEGET